MPSRSPTDPNRSEPTPENAPAYQHPADHQWNLQFLLDLKGSVASLGEKISGLTEKVEDQGKKLNTISHQIYAAWAILIVFGIIGGFLINHLWDPMTRLLVKALISSSPTHP
jgi:hypothetical protein